MHLVLALTLISCVPVFSFAADPVYPKEIRPFATLSFKSVAQSQLPAGVSFWINECAETTQEPEFRGRTCYIDLNRDRQDELILLSRCKRSNQFNIFENRAGRWVQICVIWSTEVHLLAPRNSYCQIEARTIGVHGETLSRQLFSFRKPRYHITRFDEYRHDTYIASHDPSRLDDVLERDYKNQFDHQ